MSKAAKKVIYLLIVLILASMGVAGKFVIDTQKLQEANSVLESELQTVRAQEANARAEIQKISAQLDRTKNDLTDVNNQLNRAKDKSKELMDRVNEITQDRDKHKDRYDKIKKDRDELMAKVQNLISDNDRLRVDIEKVKEEAEEKAAEAVPEQKMTRAPKRVSSGSSIPVSESDETYWAQLLKDKASLEIQVAELEDELSQNSLEIVELTQAKTELEIEFDTLVHEKEELEREIVRQEGLVNNLSLELARTKNDKKFISDRSKTVVQENADLRSKLKMLTSTKGALEKSIVRLSQDKQKIEGQLGQSETIIQSKIDEIWEIKDSLDKAFNTSKGLPPSNDIELPPIVVSSNGPEVSFDSGASHPGLNGKVVSINQDNNFIIIDVGQESGVQVGDKLSVYRDAKYLASLEVIQVRKDIAAADVKDQWTKIEVGDIVQ